MATNSRFREPLSSTSIVEAISTNVSTVDDDVAREMRREYLKILDSKYISTFQQKRDELYKQIVKPVYRSLRLKQEVSQCTFKIIDKENSAVKSIDIIDKIITVGRIKDNDVYLTEDTTISRVQGYIFTAGDKMLFLDIWSVAGTSTKQRSDKSEKCVSTLPKDRNILMFNKNEIVHLSIANDKVHILIIPKDADQKQLEAFPIYKDYQELKSKEETAKDNADDEKKNDAQNVLSDNEEQPKKDKKLSAKQQKFKDWICDELDLSEYYEIFVENGFDDIEVVKLLDDDGLKEIGIDKKGSRMKIILYAKKVKTDDTTNNNDTQDVEGADLDEDCTAMLGK